MEPHRNPNSITRANPNVITRKEMKDYERSHIHKQRKLAGLATTYNAMKAKDTPEKKIKKTTRNPTKRISAVAYLNETSSSSEGDDDDDKQPNFNLLQPKNKQVIDLTSDSEPLCESSITCSISGTAKPVTITIKKELMNNNTSTLSTTTALSTNNTSTANTTTPTNNTSIVNTTTTNKPTTPTNNTTIDNTTTAPTNKPTTPTNSTSTDNTTTPKKIPVLLTPPCLPI